MAHVNTNSIQDAKLEGSIVDREYQRNGLGSLILKSILDNKLMTQVEKVYVMTTHCEIFYKNNNFQYSNQQKLMYFSSLN